MKTFTIKDDEAALIIHDGAVEVIIPEKEGATANAGQMYIVTIGALMAADPEKEPGFHALIRAKMNQFFNEDTAKKDE